MASQEGDGMSLISTKSLVHEIDPGLVRICPTMDLIAVATRDGRVEVYRLTGQRAFGVQRKSKGLRIVSICWKYNGQYLAVSWSDGVVDIISSETGNALQNFKQVTSFKEDRRTSSGSENSSITCLGWGMSLLDIQAARTKTQHTSNVDTSKGQTQESKISLDDFLERIPDLESLDMPIQLPDQLATFDATELMPKLPPLTVLPASAYRSGQVSMAEIFSTQSLLDAVLHKGPSSELNALNTFLLSGRNGSVRLVVYDSLSIGNIELPNSSQISSVKHLKHFFHPFAHCHVLLSRLTQTNGVTCTVLIPISFRFLKSAGRNIHFIDFKTAQLDTLVQYIGECVLALNYHWKHAHDLPSRFQENISESLAEAQEPTLAQSLYQLAATGYCSETMKEWVTDQLAERGHKRWDQAVSQGYTKVMELLQENLVPALDRCHAVVTNLQGLAQYYEHSPAFDVPLSSFSTIQDIIRCMRLIVHHMLLYGSQEQQRYHSFSRWIRHQIDVLGSDPTSTVGQDLLERDAGVDIVHVFAYIEEALEKSKLDEFLCQPTDAPTVSAEQEMYDHVRKALEDFKHSKSNRQDILKFASYHNEWCRQNKVLIEQITTWQRTNALIPGAIMINENTEGLCEIRMIANESSEDNLVWSYVATVSNQKSGSVMLHRFLHSQLFDDIAKSVQASEAVHITLPHGNIQDLKFVDDHEILLLVEHQNSSRLVSIQLSQKSSTSSLPFTPLDSSIQNLKWPQGRPIEPSEEFQITEDVLESWTRYQFPHEVGFRPLRIETNGRKKRRLCVVVKDDSKQIKIFDLDSSEEDGGSVAEEAHGQDNMEEDD